MSYVIGSFNIQDFTDDGLYTKRGTPEGVRPADRNIGAIADMILAAEFDIVALQEVRGFMAVQRLEKYLGPHWESFCNQTKLPDADADAGPEFAFLWNGKRVDLSKDVHNESILPSVMNEYTGGFKRTPFLGRFTPHAAPMAEIRLINVHLKSGGARQTREEFLLLAGDVYRQQSAKRFGENRDVYTIILGDYNLCCKYCNMPEFVYFEEHLTATKQDLPTTIKMDKSGYTANDYDHFGYDENSEQFYGRSISITRVDVPDNDFEGYKKRISDHVPIKLALEMNPRR